MSFYFSTNEIAELGDKASGEKEAAANFDLSNTRSPQNSNLRKKERRKNQDFCTQGNNKKTQY